jgi:hypothetical protein
VAKGQDRPTGVGPKVLLFLLGCKPSPDDRPLARESPAGGAGRAPRGARPGPLARWLPVAFVCLIWVLALAAAGVKGYCGLKTPSTDDWEIVKTVGQPLPWTWLWEQHGESGNHRIPLPKLILRSVYEASGYDCRWGIWLNVALLAAAALALTWTARRLRGRTIYADAVFPLVVLHWVSAPLWWGFHLQFTSSTVLACVILAVMVRYGSRLTTGAAWLAGLCVLALPLCGANGLALVPALAVWLAVAGLAAWYAASPRGKKRALLLFAFALAGPLLIALYYSGYENQGDRLAVNSVSATAKVMASFFSVDLALLSDDYYLSQLKTYVPYLPYGRNLEVVLLLVSLALLLYIWRKRPERSRAFALLMFFGAFFCLALGLAVARGGNWSDFHYRLLAAPVLFGIYFVWEDAGGRWVPRVVQYGILLAALVALPLTIWENLSVVMTQWHRQLAFDRDVLAGVPASALADQYSDLCLYADQGDNSLYAGYLVKLHDAGKGMYRYLKKDPAYLEVPIPLNEGRDAADPLLVNYALERPGRVYAIRLKYSFGQPIAYTSTAFRVKITWEGHGPGAVPGEGRGKDMEWEGYVDGPGKNFTVWINEDASKVTLTQELKPDFAGDPEVVLLVPAGSQVAGAQAPEGAAQHRMNGK